MPRFGTPHPTSTTSHVCVDPPRRFIAFSRHAGSASCWLVMSTRGAGADARAMRLADRCDEPCAASSAEKRTEATIVGGFGDSRRGVDLHSANVDLDEELR